MEKNIIEKKRLAKRAQGQFRKQIEAFAKRSKFITIVQHRTYWGRIYLQINVDKYNKVVNEMIEYFKTLCNYVEEDNDDTMWIRNYNDLTEENNELWAIEYDICVHCLKNK